MADEKELEVIEAQDGSATVDLPEGTVLDDQSNEQNGFERAKEGGEVADPADEDHEDDDEELRAAKRNIKKTSIIYRSI